MQEEVVISIHKGYKEVTWLAERVKPDNLIYSNPFPLHLLLPFISLLSASSPGLDDRIILALGYDSFMSTMWA